MTSPVAGGGKQFTLTPGNPVLLTEYAAGVSAPLSIINTSDTAVVYVADSSSVSPGSGVPLNGGTSLPWAQPGQVWAVLDPAAAGTATVVITGAISSWSPSPAALAAATATELLTSGVPNVLTETVIGNVTNGVPTDVHEYASLNLSIDTPGAVQYAQYYFCDANGDQLTATDTVMGGTLIPVLGPYIVTTSPYQVYLIGSNRPSPQGRPIGAGYSSEGFEGTLGATTMTANSSWAIAPNKGTLFQGPAFLAFSVTGATPKGFFQANTMGGNTVELCDTTEMHTGPSSGLWFFRTAALPSNLVNVTYFSTVAGSFNPGIKGVPNY